MTDETLEILTLPSGLTLVIDTARCAGYMACRSLAPEAFELGDGGVIAFREPAQVDRERLLQACRACPTRALIVREADGTQLVP